MAQINWTDDQQKAISSTKGTVLVSAAAGSGKTAVLVERVIRILTDSHSPCNADEILVVTFTRAAAAQMKEKITKRLTEMSAADRKDRNLRKQLLLLPGAEICTIDSFCSNVVRNNYQYTDTTPDCRVLDEGESEILKAAAFEETAEKMHMEQDEGFLKLSEMFSSSGNDDKLREIILKMYAFACARAFPEKWMRDIKDNFSENNPVWKKCIVKYGIRRIEYCLEMNEKALELLKEDDIIFSSYSDAFLSDKAEFERIKVKAEEFNGEDEKWDEIIKGLSFTFEKLGSKPNGYEAGAAAKHALALRDNCKEQIKKLRESFCADSAQNRADAEFLRPAARGLSDFLIEFSNCLQKKKREKNCCDFNDILHNAIELFTDEEGGKTDIARQYSEKYKYILVDEYQDTNEAQDMLFRSISRNEENLFFVGDVKQSIYGFRQAMPEIFTEKRRRFNTFNGDNYPANIILGQNFRSREGITKWVNFVFSEIMRESVGGIEYNENEYLYSAGEYTPREEPCVEIDILEKKNYPGMENYEAEAEHIVSRIEGILNSGMTVKGENGEERPVKKGDICVLVRSGSQRIAAYIKALNKGGIPANSADSGSVFDSPEGKILMSLLKTVDDPLNDVAAVSAMMSPVFGFTPDDMANLRKGDGKRESVYSCVLREAEKGNEKCRYFIEKTEKYRLMSVTAETGELLEKIIDDTAYDKMVLAMKNGRSRRENLFIIADYARGFSASGNMGLSEFIRIADNMKKNKKRLDAAPRMSAGEDCVSVMTIHKSKGLEFPVCLLVNCAGEFNDEDTKGMMMVSSRLGAGCKIKDKSKMVVYDTLSHRAVKLEEKNSSRAEELRILYVAMTRAKEKLICVMTLDNVGKKVQSAGADVMLREISPVAVTDSNTYSKWLLMCALKHPGAKALREMADIGDEIVKDCDFGIRINLCERGETVKTEELIPAQSDEEIIKLIREKTEYRYEYEYLRGIPVKRGASDAKEVFSSDFFASERPSFMNKDGLTPALRGTAMHLFMQHCDYIKARESLEDEISRLREKGFINGEQADSLDRKKLSGFFMSSLAKRMLSSEKLYREKKFIIHMSPREFDDSLPLTKDNIVVQGILDCAFEEDGKIVVVDYKTDKVKTEEELKRRYFSQLRIYTRAVKECLGKEVSQTVIYSFFLQKEIIL